MNTDRYLRFVEKIADKICNDSLWYETQCNWVGVFHGTQIANAKTVVRALPSNFYNGSAGVAYFLSAAYHQFGKPLYKKTALGALEKTLGQLPKIKTERIGFYEGLSGIAYTLFRSSVWLAEPHLRYAAKVIIDDMANNPTTEWGLEAQDGCPSAIPTLIALNQHFQDPAIDDFVERIGNFILGKASKTPEGWYWLADDQTVKVGYAHGLSGVAHALAELYIRTKQPHYLEALEQAIRFENHYYKPTKNRSDWCVGSVGVCFSRWASYEATGHKSYLKAMKESLKNSFSVSVVKSQNFTLCHGFVGDMALLRWASQKGYVAPERVIKKINGFLDRGQDFEKPLADGKGFYLENPTFMLGWAGIAYFLLQLHSPTDYPEMLLITTLK
jgi:lantibiotic biosynthesis protein